MGADYSKALWVACKNFWPGNKGMDYVVIHATASGGVQTAMQLATGSEFNDGQTASVHYINNRDTSQVIQVVSEANSAWGNCCATGNSPFDHNVNWNWKSISIENVKYSNDNSEPLTTWQYQNLLDLVRDICHRHTIPLVHGSPTQRGILFHHDLDPVNRARCPGTFPYTTFFQDLQGGTTTPILTPTHEVAVYPQSYQYEPNETGDACGFYANALAKAMGNPSGTQPALTTEQVDVLADQYYVQYNGQNASWNTKGMAEPTQQEAMLNSLGIPFTHIAIDSNSDHNQDIALITAWLKLGYPVIVLIPTASVYDMDVGAFIYGGSGNHFITASGIDVRPGFAGHLMYRDTANSGPSPRTYSNDHIVIYHAIAINPPWLPQRPDSFDPLQGGDQVEIPAGWKDDGTILTAPNGHKVVRGFRNYILTHPWDPGDVPQEEEHGQNPLEAYYNQPNNTGTQQIFLYTTLNWNTTRNVYKMGVGNEFLHTRNDLIACRAGAKP
jgi:N-acetyl-anhydromuramyl-L-alanine amidase AmpD